MIIQKANMGEFPSLTFWLTTPLLVVLIFPMQWWPSLLDPHDILKDHDIQSLPNTPILSHL